MVQRNALQIAAHLIKLGLAPVALMAPDDPRELLKPAAQRGKQPILARWNEGPAPKSVKDMPELRPEHNVGIRTGYVAGARHCVVALDEDSEGAHYFCEDTQPSTTMETLTGRMTAGWRGRHRFYRRPEGGRFPNRALKVKWQNPFNDDRVEVLALDVRGDGGQVVAPGSLHGTGGLYEEAATWTEAMLQSLPVLDLAALEKCLADTKADSKAIDDKFPRAQRVRRFRAYLEKCEPSYPQMPPYGAGAHALIIARAGVWGLDLPVEVVAEEMQRSGWNKKCKFDDGSPYPWSLEELRHKCKDADRMATSDGDMQKRRGWMLEEPEKKSERAVIEITPNVSKVASEVLVALADARDSLGSPLVYASSGHLSVVQPPGIHWLDRHALSLAMDKAAMFQVHVERGRGDEKEVVAEQKQPPMHIADKILSAGHWPELPALKRISRLPPVTLSGCIGLKPGYDMQSQIYYLGQPVHIPDAPTKGDAQAALQRILRYVRSVKFATDTDKAKWVAYLLTFATRTAYDKAPVFLISAAFQGSGKSCLAYMPFKMLYSERLKPADYKESDDPDFGKSLYGWSQMPLVLWDNMPDGKCLRHAALAAILTNGVATARELSKHSFLDSDFGATIFCYTGNKVTLDADLACRAVVINLLGKPDKDPNFSPEQDRAFDAIRPGVLRDVYTIIRAWALAGCPPQPAQPHDRFGEWSQVVQQIVLWLGLENPVTSNDDMNADKDHLMVFLHEAERLFKDKPFRAQDLIEMATNGGRSAVEAVAAVAELCRQRRAESAIRLGQQLKAICQRDAEGLVLLHCGATNGYHRYRITRSAISRASGATLEPQSVPQAQLPLGSVTEKKGNG